MQHTTAIQKFEAHFETRPDVPPPYCHWYSLKVSPTPEGLQVQYQIQYTDREGLGPEELADEGFGPNDDRQCRATLGAPWVQALQAQWQRLKPAPAPPPDRDALTLKLQHENGQMQELFPAKAHEWEYFLQEMVQATLEAAGLEDLLRVEYLNIDPDGQRQQTDLAVSFAERKGDLYMARKGAHTLNWDECKDLMQLTFTAEFVPEEASEKPPKQPGFYLHTSDGLWYQSGVSVFNPSPKNDVLKKIQKKINHFYEN